MRLVWHLIGDRWLLISCICSALNPDAWLMRTAEGYAPNRPWPADEFRQVVLQLGEERGIKEPAFCEIGIVSGRVGLSFINGGRPLHRH